MKLRARVRQKNESIDEEKGKKIHNGLITDCELIERDPLTGQIIRIERHEVLLKWK